MRLHRADQLGVFIGQVIVESLDRTQAAVDGRGLEAAGNLGVDEPVDVVKGDCRGLAVPDYCDELAQVVGVIPPGAGIRVAPADSFDEVFDLG
jgi:hypothetical protein